jgi:hypothetical protein
MKILVINPDYKDATSYYRAWGTFKDLQDRYDFTFVNYSNVAIMAANKVAWPDLISFDVALFQRALGENSLQLLSYLKEIGLKIWYDLDDDLWNIPDSYKIKPTFNFKAIATIEEHIKQSDLITCSTEPLADVIKEKTGRQANVIPNAWDIKRFPLKEHNPQGITLWRGSNTHEQDLRSNRDLIEALAKETHLTFMGFDPVKEKPLLNILKYTFEQPKDPFHYFRWIQESRPKQFIVLLQDSKFNQSKSNIAWIEATAAGSLCYSNRVGEFSKVGLDIDLIETIKDYEQVISMEQSKIKDCYSLEYWNNVRAKLLIQVCK